MLERGLQLLGFCDEIVVVVDARTDDRTEEIARRYTDRVWVEEFEDFASHKNAAIEQAHGDWVLIVDADERVTPALAARDPGDAARATRPSGASRSRSSASSSAAACATAAGSRTTCAWSAASTRAWRGAIHEHLSMPPERTGTPRRGHVALLAPLDRGDARQDDPLRRRAVARAAESGRAAGHRAARSAQADARGVRLADGPPARLQGRDARDHRGALPAVLAVLRAGDAVAAPARARRSRRPTRRSSARPPSTDEHATSPTSTSTRSGSQPGDAVVDVGCGDGGLAELLARAGLRVTGVEPAAYLRERFDARCTRSTVGARGRRRGRSGSRSPTARSARR